MRKSTKYLPFRSRALSGLLRLFFYLLYNQFAWSYDFVADTVSLGKWDEWILTVLPYLNGSRILELGHGTGHLQVEMCRREMKVIGLDSSKRMGRIALKRIVGGKFLPLLVNGYAQFLPFPDRSFDQVVSTFPSEYIFDIKSLNEVWRVLTPGGSLIILPVAWIRGNQPLERMAAWLFRFTGQASAWDSRMVMPFQNAGFEIQTNREIINSSVILLVFAIKPNDHNLVESNNHQRATA
jgi:ubiquinone/menaquinone biosynthesis C-methylase UbiE